MFGFHRDSSTLFLNRLLKVGDDVLLVGAINLFLEIKGLRGDFTDLIFHRFAPLADFPTSATFVAWD